MKTQKTKFGYEVSEVMYLGKSFDEIKELIPKGWKIISYQKCSQLYQTIIRGECIWCLDNEGKSARFNVNWYGAELYCDWDPSIPDSSLGVRFVREIKK